MINFTNSIKKKYYKLKRQYTNQPFVTHRLIVKKAKWYKNADSPVILMIDDFTNAWHSKKNKERWDEGGDWGGGLLNKGSALDFLQKNLLDRFPKIKTTLFTVTGKINPYTFKEPFAFAAALNETEEAKKTFRKISEDKRFEFAYHGLNHGFPGEKPKDFMQEWSKFQSVDEAVSQIESGRKIFEEVFGEKPAGGKYGGWRYNGAGDASIDKTGFLWWCRDWMPRDTAGKVDDSYYDPQFFGDNFVVALPSTVHGFFWDESQLEMLLRKKQIISVQEHIAPLRPDNNIQKPNIIEDIYELNKLFDYIKDRNIWHAKGIEIAEYFTAYSLTLLSDITKDSFRISYNGRFPKPSLTLLFDFRHLHKKNEDIKILSPEGETFLALYDYKTGFHKADIKVVNGKYAVGE